MCFSAIRLGIKHAIQRHVFMVFFVWNMLFVIEGFFGLEKKQKTVNAVLIENKISIETKNQWSNDV